MKFLFASVLFLAGVAFAQEPLPFAAPSYRIPLPDDVEKLRPSDRLPKMEDAWERDFVQCLATEDDVARMARFLELLGNLPTEKFPAGIAAFQKIDELGMSGMRLPERDFFWERYGRLARENAVKEAAKLAIKDTMRASTLPGKALLGWARVAPDEAKRWFETRPEPVVADPMMLRPLVLGMAAKDLKAATAFFVENAKPNTREFIDTLTGLRDFVVARDFMPGLIAWFEMLPDQDSEPSVKSAALLQVLQRFDGTTFESGAQFLDSIKNPKVATEMQIQRFASGWTSKGRGADVMKWLLSRPKNDKGLRAGVSSAAQVWAGKDPKAFAGWLLENRTHESIDQVLLGFVKYLANRDIAEARKWMQEIKTPALRTEAEESL